MGHVAVGMQDMADRQRRGMNQNLANYGAGQINEVNDINLARMREADAERQRLAAVNRDFATWEPAQMPTGVPAGTAVAAGAPAVAPMPITGTPVAGTRPGAPAPAQMQGDPGQWDAAIAAYEQAKGRDQASLDKLRQGNKYKEGQQKLALGVAGPVSAAADVLTMPVRGIGMLTEQAVNLGGRAVNTVAGKRVVRDDYDTVSRQGSTPYYDMAVRNNEYFQANPEEQKILDRMKGYDQGIAAAREGKGKTKPAAAPAQAGGAVTQVTPELVQRFINDITPTESGGNPNAVNKDTQARGITQITPQTAAEIQRVTGRAPDLTSLEGQKQATADYLGILINQLQAKGVQPTYDALKSAWLQGAGGVSRNGVMATNVADANGMTPAAYVQKTGGAAPMPANMPAGQQPQPQQVAGQQPQQGGVPAGEYTFVTAEQNNYERQQLARQAQYYMQVAKASGDPAVQIQALQQLDGLRMRDRELQLQQVVTAAEGGVPQAWEALQSVISAEFGAPVSIKADQSGQVTVVTQDPRTGQPVLMAQGPASQVARGLYSVLSPSARAAAAANRAAASAEYAKADAQFRGKEGPLEAMKSYGKVQELIMQNNLQGALEMLKSDNNVLLEMTKHGLTGNEFNHVANDQVTGGFLLTTKDGRAFRMVPPKQDANFTTPAKLEQVPMGR
jgi:hypothetical protein